MEVTAVRSAAQRSVAQEVYFGSQSGEGDVITFAEYTAQLRAPELFRNIPVEAAVQIEMDLLAVTAHPLCLPSLWRKVVFHVSFDAHPENEISKRKRTYFCISAFLSMAALCAVSRTNNNA